MGHTDLESGFFPFHLSVRRNSRPRAPSSRPVSIQYDHVSIGRRIMGTRRNIGPLLLGLFVGLGVIAALGISPAFATTSPTYSCTVSVTYTTKEFYVKTIVTASGGYLPGPRETDNVKAYVNGVLYNTQTSNYSIGTSVVSTTVTIPVSSNGSGSYTFLSTILNNKGVQLTSCTGTYKL
jgi:hypothetical protein